MSWVELESRKLFYANLGLKTAVMFLNSTQLLM